MKTFNYLSIILLLFVLVKPLQAKVSVITYNVGMTPAPLGITLVPCSRKRLKAQNQAIFHGREDISQGEPFILLLQEVWTRRAFEAFTKNAKLKGFHIAPTSFKEIDKNGQMIITNLSPAMPNWYKMHRFSSDEPVVNSRGVLIAKLLSPEGKRFNAANIHTTYSTSKEFIKVHGSHFTEITDILNRYKTPTVIGGDFNAGPDLDFKKSRYNVSQALWFGEEGIHSKMSSIDFRVASDPYQVTWDDDNNELVYNPTLAIKAFNTFSFGTFAWEEKTSTLDHIFVSKGLKSFGSDRVFFKPGKFSCGKRSSGSWFNKYTNLSDHYGVLVQIDIL